MNTRKRRKLAAIMFTDIVGYSSIMQQDEDRGFEIRSRHRRVFEDLTDHYNGKLLQYFGDGTLSIFDSTADAVECAIEMQKKFHLPPKVPLRIGIHTGDITLTDDDAYGHGLNIAARIEPICIPGGIYVSGKVNDEIKNHPWVTTQSVGFYELKNIDDAIEIFAVTNEGVNIPEFELIEDPPPEYQRQVSETVSEFTPFKNKIVAGVIAFFLGIFGVHRFYLGQRGIGIAFFATAMVGIISGVWFLIAIPAILGFIEAVMLLAMSKSEFNYKYNTIKPDRKDRTKEIPVERKTIKPKVTKVAEEIDVGSALTVEERAVKAVKIGDFDTAISHFLTLLKEEPQNKNFHFALATCYSMTQDAKKGFYHLSKAVEYGYDNYQKIKNHFTLAYLRSRNEFREFEKNGYRLIKMLPAPQEDLLDSERPLLLEKLERLERLGDSLQRGEISEEEFSRQKNSLLRED